MKLGHESVEPLLWKAEAGVLSNGSGRGDNDADELLVDFDDVVLVAVDAFAFLLFLPFSSGVALLLELLLLSGSSSSKRNSCSLISPENRSSNSSEDCGDGGSPVATNNVGI
jgi:hypothetical protein